MPTRVVQAGGRWLHSAVMACGGVVGSMAGAGAGAVRGSDALDRLRRRISNLPVARMGHDAMRALGIQIPPLEVQAAGNIAAWMVLPLIFNAIAPGLGLIPFVLGANFGLKIGEAIAARPGFKGIGAHAGWKKGKEAGRAIGRKLAESWITGNEPESCSTRPE